LARAVAEADVIISLPKLKTHGQMAFTGTLKNQYGLIPGTLKSQWHFRLQRREWLAALILDVHRTARPALAIMDGVVGMEGKGPSGGRPRRLGAILASPDLVALDTLACRLISLEPRLVPALEAARAEGLGAAEEDIQVVGTDWQALRVPDFEKVSRLEDLRRLVPLPGGVLNWIREHWTAKPRIVEARCTECGACEEGCPVTPAAIHPTAPERQRVDDDACIRCYCCHEFCPNNAIDLFRPGLLGPLRLDPLARQSQNLFSRLWPGRRRPDEPGLD
jgi:ferredoxin